MRHNLTRNDEAVSAAIATVLLFGGVVSIIGLMLVSMLPIIEELEGLVIFEAIPGEYLIEREALNIHRKVLEEGWGH